MDSEKETLKSPMIDEQKKVEDDGDVLESILKHVGEMGRYQKLLFLAMAPVSFTFAFVYFVQMFIIATPQDHWCRVPELENLDIELRRNLSAPLDERCKMYVANWSEVLQTMTPPPPGTPLQSCQHGWEYQLTDIPYHTVVSERDWICQNSSYVPISSAMFFVGCIIGTLFFGWIADLYGRVPALMGANLIGCLGGIASTFTTGFYDFAICRFLLGLSYDSCFMMMYILVLEYVGPRHRTWVANMSVAVFFGPACVALPFIALQIADWRNLSLATSLPMLLVMVAPFFVPESARWLASRGRTDEAIKVLNRFEKVNKTKIPQDVLDDFIISSKKPKEVEEKVTVTTLFKSSELRTMMVIMTVAYISVAMVFDGLVRMSENMGMDFFITFALASATEIPSLALLTILLDRWGRRYLTCGPVAISGILVVIAAFVPKGVPQASLAICARFFVNMTFSTLMQWATELLPTPVRATGSSILHVSGFIGGLMSPFVVYSERFWAPLPLLVMGVLSLVACGMGALLPETMGRQLPQTIEDGEQLIQYYSLCGKRPTLEDESDEFTYRDQTVAKP